MGNSPTRLHARVFVITHCLTHTYSLQRSHTPHTHIRTPSCTHTHTQPVRMFSWLLHTYIHTTATRANSDTSKLHFFVFAFFFAVVAAAAANTILPLKYEKTCDASVCVLLPVGPPRL
eukprot:GHVU01134233.1.p1 GENE.GHVU01134233.1~~GHVU01134233.1.p1  ORF type:complete len:118 (+),score=7.52 GHVU01134233.1:410-763(+)